MIARIGTGIIYPFDASQLNIFKTFTIVGLESKWYKIGTNAFCTLLNASPRKKSYSRFFPGPKTSKSSFPYDQRPRAVKFCSAHKSELGPWLRAYFRGGLY